MKGLARYSFYVSYKDNKPDEFKFRKSVIGEWIKYEDFHRFQRVSRYSSIVPCRCHRKHRQCALELRNLCPRSPCDLMSVTTKNKGEEHAK